VHESASMVSCRKKRDLDPSGTKRFAVLRHCGHEELISPNCNAFHSALELKKNVFKKKKTPQTAEILFLENK